MKTTKILMTIVMSFLIFTASDMYAQSHGHDHSKHDHGQHMKSQEGKQEASFKVSGNCGMCKSTIEKAAKSVKGVESADWDIEKQMIKLTYSDEKLKLDAVHNAIAKVGYDTEKVKADSKVYNALPGCCQYR